MSQKLWIYSNKVFLKLAFLPSSYSEIFVGFKLQSQSKTTKHSNVYLLMQ